MFQPLLTLGVAGPAGPVSGARKDRLSRVEIPFFRKIGVENVPPEIGYLLAVLVMRRLSGSANKTAA